MLLTVQEQSSQQMDSKRYHVREDVSPFQSNSPYDVLKVVAASVVPISQVHVEHPELETNIDTDDLTRMRFVVVLQDSYGQPLRLRLSQWNDLNLHRQRQLPRQASAVLAKDWAVVLMHAVENMKPREMEQRLECLMYGTTRDQDSTKYIDELAN